MGFGQDLFCFGAEGVDEPGVAFVVANEEFWAAGAGVEAVRFDGGKDDSQADKDGDGDGDDEDDEKDTVCECGLVRPLQGAGCHGGEQGEAEGGFGVDEADGVLGVFDDFVEELEAAGVFEDLYEWGQVRHGRECIKGGFAEPGKQQVPPVR